MDHPFWVIVAIFALGWIYVLAPVAVDTFMRYRKTRTVMCPEKTTPAEIQIDAGQAALLAVAGKTALQIRHCTLWATGKCDCAQGCALALR